jgi:hypothetical protein
LMDYRFLHQTLLLRSSSGKKLFFRLLKILELISRFYEKKN